MNKAITSMLMFFAVIVVLSACSSSNCNSGTERRPGDLVTGQKPANVTLATLCTDKTDYNKGDIVHITFTLKNLLDEQLVLDNGQQPVMDICVPSSACLSKYQTDVAQLTRLVLEPGQSRTIQWDWPTPDMDMSNSIIARTGVGSIDGNKKRLDGGIGSVNVQFFYGPRREWP